MKMKMKKEEREGKNKNKKRTKKGVVTVVVNKGAWTAEEDHKLAEYVKCHGEKNWRILPAKAGLKRCGKSCRLRWLNYLRPGIKRGNITDEEEDLIIRLHNLLGNRWSLIAGRLPGRTDNEIKNHWNTHLSRRSMSIDALNLKLNTRSVSSPRGIIPLDRVDSQRSEFYYDWEQLLTARPHQMNDDLDYEFGRWMGEENNLFGWEPAAYEQAAVWRNGGGTGTGVPFSPLILDGCIINKLAG